jgi:hypothetical protein
LVGGDLTTLPDLTPTHLSGVGGAGSTPLLLFLGDLNTLFLLFLLLFSTFLISTNTALHLLLTAEVL